MANDRPSFLVAVAEQEATCRQLRGAKALAKLLNNAFHEGLPAIDWRLSAESMLIGRIMRPGRSAQKREALIAWAVFLGNTPRPEVTTSDGRTVLLVDVKRHPAYNVDIIVGTDWYQDGEEAEATEPGELGYNCNNCPGEACELREMC